MVFNAIHNPSIKALRPLFQRDWYSACNDARKSNYNKHWISTYRSFWADPPRPLLTTTLRVTPNPSKQTIRFTWYHKALSTRDFGRCSKIWDLDSPPLTQFLQSIKKSLLLSLPQATQHVISNFTPIP